MPAGSAASSNARATRRGSRRDFLRTGAAAAVSVGLVGSNLPFTLAGREVRISASIGSAAATDGGVDEVLRHADLAMYVAKRTEKGSHRAFEAKMLN